MKIILFITSLLVLNSAFSQDVKKLYDEGVGLKKENKMKEAKAKFEAVLKIDPTYAAAIFELGWIDNEDKQYYKALEKFRKIKDIWATTPKLYFEMGYAYYKLEKLDSAEINFNKTLALKNDYANAHKLMGYIAYDKNENAKALAAFALYKQYNKVAITDYLYWYREGYCHNALKNYTEAVTALNLSAQFNKEYLNTYLEKGYAFSKLKNADSALAAYEQAKAINPKNHIAYNGIAEVYRDIKMDYNTAITIYQETLKVKANERKACFGIGYCYNVLQKYNDAILYLKKAIEQEPSYTAAYVEYGYSLYKTGKNEEALVQLNTAMTQNPKNENAKYYAVLVYISLKNKLKAEQIVDELRQLNSKYTNELKRRVETIQ
jgi:tetratricopeptide (TPR) repeat protein